MSISILIQRKSILILKRKLNSKCNKRLKIFLNKKLKHNHIGQIKNKNSQNQAARTLNVCNQLLFKVKTKQTWIINMSTRF